jgi:hypothetical protein
MDAHFNAYKVKFERLNELIRPIRNSQPIHTVNIYINLDDFFHSLHRPLTNNEFQVCGVNAGKQLISNIFNLAGHYRQWCLRNHLQCKIYGIYTSSLRSFKNSIYTVDYRKYFKEINDKVNAKFFFINEAIHGSIPLLPVISKYIPDVYMIDSKYLEPSIVPAYISENSFTPDWNILISRDPYDLQYAYRDKWSFISPKGDNTILVNRNNFWEYLMEREHIDKPDQQSKMIYYPCDLYILAKAVVGDKFRNIPRLRKIGWKTLFNMLDKLLDEHSSDSYAVLQNELYQVLKGKRVSDDDLTNNLYSVNINNQLKTLIEIDKTSIDMQIVDVPDYENLKQLNQIQFAKFPINLGFLCNNMINPNFKRPF